MAAAVDASGKGHVLVNSVHPGLCNTQIFRDVPFPFSLIISLILILIGRSSEAGSRTLIAGAFAGEDCHGAYMSECQRSRYPKIMHGEEGEEMAKKTWLQLLALLEEVEPRVTKNL
jgi:retinol dehydrogenase 12